jgi:CRP-like cAMP-binding protein
MQLHRQFLDRVPFLSFLTSGQLDLLASVIAERHYGPRELIFQEGEPARGLCIVHSGIVAVYKVVEGENTFLKTLGVGEHFGEIALVSDTPRTATVIAEGHTSLLVIGRADFERAMEQTPALWSYFRKCAENLTLDDFFRVTGGLDADDPDRHLERLVEEFGDPAAGF